MASKFETAFAAARKSGKKEFSFGGKSYNTKLKKDDSGPKNVPTPKARPVGAKASASASKPSEAKASTKAEPKSKKVFTLDKPKSYTERSKQAESTKKSTGSKPAFQLGPKTASYADRNKADDEKKKRKITTGGGGGY